MGAQSLRTERHNHAAIRRTVFSQIDFVGTTASIGHECREHRLALRIHYQHATNRMRHSTTPAYSLAEQQLTRAACNTAVSSVSSCVCMMDTAALIDP